MFSIASTPVKQSVGETIGVLSGRLTSAALLEDRRAAILGLRSFAKEYPASVASGALRSLIGSLSKDGEDVDTVKVVLETLLMLLSPNEDSPEASEDIALWLADEFTQRQDNITLLLDLLDTADFYSRLYSLQLLAAILAARTERTEECIFTAPLGISRLVAILDDRREAIRNEAINLLTSLTPTAADIQKLVAFENAFDRIFKIIELEGSLSNGGRVIEDCLILLANLLQLNPSNQALFRESGGVAHLSKLLQGICELEEDGQQIAAWAQAQRNRNTYALLAVLRLFLHACTPGTSQNQDAFWNHGLLYHALQLAFSHGTDVQIKAQALAVCADIIRGNARLQERFAQLRVMSPFPVPPSDQLQHSTSSNDIPQVYVIDGLLDITLGVQAPQAFDVRMAACECLKAYFSSHADVRLHFLRRAIEGHSAGADETANVLTTLLRPSDESASSDPYRYWFAAVIMFHLLFEDPNAKRMAMAVTVGDEANGEEVVTSIQTITAHLIRSLDKRDDPRMITGYLMLLLGWLFEDDEAVNDFLGEGSNLQGVIQAAVRNPQGDIIVQGLCTALLGVVYEFATKDSVISRATLQSIIMDRMGRDRYIDRLNHMRKYPLLRDFEVLPQKLDPSSGQKWPDVFFDAAFVDFFKDSFSRLVRAIDRDPDLESPFVANGVQRGISRELVDSLRKQLDTMQSSLERVHVQKASVESQLVEEQAKQKRINDSAAAEMGKLQSTLEASSRVHEHEVEQLKAHHRAAAEALVIQLEHVQRVAELDAQRQQRRSEAEIADLRATVSRLEIDLVKANKSQMQELQASRESFESIISDERSTKRQAEEKAHDLERRLQAAEIRVLDLEAALEVARDKCIEAEQNLDANKASLQKMQFAMQERADEQRATQAELDDLLMVFGDLEEKVAKYKARLQATGEDVSEVEDELDEEEESC